MVAVQNQSFQDGFAGGLLNLSWCMSSDLIISAYESAELKPLSGSVINIVS